MKTIVVFGGNERLESKLLPLLKQKYECGIKIKIDGKV